MLDVCGYLNEKIRGHFDVSRNNKRNAVMLAQYRRKIIRCLVRFVIFFFFFFFYRDSLSQSLDLNRNTHFFLSRRDIKSLTFNFCNNFSAHEVVHIDNCLNILTMKSATLYVKTSTLYTTVVMFYPWNITFAHAHADVSIIYVMYTSV